MKLFIIRHGETSWNVEGRFQGKQDTELTPYGVSQAELAAERLRGHRFDAVVSSPLARAKVTAEKIFAAADCSTFEIVNDFIEIDHGEWEGVLADEVRTRWADLFERWHTSPHTVVMPGDGGESLRGVQIRAVRSVLDLAKKYSGDVLLATHDAVIKVLLCWCFAAPLSSFWRFQTANCSISIADIWPDETRAPRVTLMGDTAHLTNSFVNPEQKGI